MDTKGGRFTLDMNGRTYSGRGKASISPARATRENGVNMDGTGYSNVKPKLASLDLTFDRGVGLKWDEAMMLDELNVTFVETDARVTHLFTNANWSGDPSIDTETGEVSGLKIESDKYLAR
ncbi:phage tail tube protein [Methylobacterium sp. A54F]